MDNAFVKVPIRLLSNKNFTMTSSVVYGLILSLSYKTGYCYASNEVLGKMIQRDTRSVARSINELVQRDCITIKNSKKRNRQIYLNDKNDLKNDKNE